MIAVIRRKIIQPDKAVCFHATLPGWTLYL
jgi:hypothetical protein